MEMLNETDKYQDILVEDNFEQHTFTFIDCMYCIDLFELWW